MFINETTSINTFWIILKMFIGCFCLYIHILTLTIPKYWRHYFISFFNWILQNFVKVYWFILLYFIIWKCFLLYIISKLVISKFLKWLSVFFHKLIAIHLLIPCIKSISFIPWNIVWNKFWYISIINLFSHFLSKQCNEISILLNVLI